MKKLRSSQWYEGSDRNAYIHRAWMRRGLPDQAFEGRPHIAIANTASDLTPCNAHLNEVAQSVKNGVYEAGGIPLELPVVSLGETQVRPDRHALAKHGRHGDGGDAPRQSRSTERCSSAAATRRSRRCSWRQRRSICPQSSCPAVRCCTGTFRGVALGCGTDVWRLSEEVRAETLSEADFLRSESSMIRSRGHCNTMGTASTMATRRRGARHDRCPAPPALRRRTAAAGSCSRSWAPCRGAGRGGSSAKHGHDHSVVPQRDRGTRGDRWLDQRGGAPARHCRTSGCPI